MYVCTRGADPELELNYRISNMDAELTVDSCIRGHHVFKNVWTPTVGEQLTCQREIGNNKDRYAVVVLRNRTTVGHVPRKILLLAPCFSREKVLFIASSQGDVAILVIYPKVV